MDSEIFKKDKRVCIKPLRSRLEAVQKLQPPTTVKGCRSFVGMVNILSKFCPELKKLLKPIYDLTRKADHLFGEKNNRIPLRNLNLQFYICQIQLVRFHLYSETSKFAAGSALYQIQNGKPKLIVYTSKRIPEAAKDYSITELELCRLAINIASFSHLLKESRF